MAEQVAITQPLESNGGIPVNVQDQTTPLFDFYFMQQVGDVTTVASDTTLDSNVVTVTSTTGLSIGDMIGLFSGVSGEGRYYFGGIRNIVGSVVTLDTPLDFAFEAGDPFVKFTKDLAVDGSVTPNIFSVNGPGTGSPLEIDITTFTLIAETVGPVDLSLFGDRSPLPNGLVLRRIGSSYKNFWNIKQNSEFAVHGEWVPYQATNPAQGVDGFRFCYRIAGQENHGVTIRLGANERLELIIQDALDGFTSMRALVRGHEVTD